MLFNFVIAGTPTERLAALDDALRPLFFGLRAAGHRVVAVGQRFEKRPVVNLVVADGPIAARARHEAGPGACLGLLCVDPVTPAVRQLAQSFDFIWGCAPTAAFTAERHAVVSYGFHPALLGPKLEREPARREAGIILYGEEGPRPAALAERLTKAGLTALFVRGGHFPDYIVCDLLCRAALVVAVRHEAGDPAPPAMRMVKAITNGAAVLAEASPPADLAPYVEACDYDAIPARCAALLHDNPTQRGLEALERFKRETSMVAGLDAALRVAAAAVGSG